jgi:hypothetical protein
MITGRAPVETYRKNLDVAIERWVKSQLEEAPEWGNEQLAAIRSILAGGEPEQGDRTE